MDEISTDKESQSYYENTTFKKRSFWQWLVSTFK
jgi:hypothetical protein